MKLGIASTALDTQGLEKTFQRAGEVGAKGLEITYLTAKNAKALARKDHVQKLNQLSESTNVSVCSLALGVLCEEPLLIGPARQAATAKQLIEQALCVAADVQAAVVLLPFFAKNAIEVETELNRAIEALLDLAESAEQAGVILGVESTLNFDQQRFLLNNIGHLPSVKIYQDTGNALARKLDLATGIRDLGPEAIAQIHFRDVKLGNNKPPDFSIPLGSGDVDFAAVVRALQAVNYDGWVVLETPPGADPVASGKTNLLFAREQLGM